MCHNYKKNLKKTSTYKKTKQKAKSLMKYKRKERDITSTKFYMLTKLNTIRNFGYLNVALGEKVSEDRVSPDALKALWKIESLSTPNFMCQQSEANYRCISKGVGEQWITPNACMASAERNHLNNVCVYPNAMHVCVRICVGTLDAISNASGVRENSRRILWCVRGFPLKTFFQICTLQIWKRKGEERRMRRLAKEQRSKPLAAWATVVRYAFTQVLPYCRRQLLL